jgi:chromosome segregation ATPase
MLGLPLLYEILLVVTLACLIAWLMGRTLCKSKEYEVRAANKSLQAANDRLESLLVKKEEEIHQSAQRLQTGQKTMAELQHQQKTAENLLAKLQQAHQASLASIQELIAYRTQFEELGKVHDGQSRQVITLQETLRQTQDERAQAMTLDVEQRNALETTIQQLQKEKRDDDALIAEQQVAYQQQKQTFEKEADNLNELMVQLKKHNAELQEANEQQREVITALNEKVNGYLQSVDSTNRRIASMLAAFPAQK